MPFKPAGQLTCLEADQPFCLDVMRKFNGAVCNVDPLEACLHAQVLLHCTDNVSFLSSGDWCSARHAASRPRHATPSLMCCLLSIRGTIPQASHMSDCLHSGCFTS